MKRFLYTISLVALSLGVFASGPAGDIEKADLVSIEGMVSDKISGENLTGVKVSLQGSEKVHYTDFDGKFRIDNLKPGKYTVLVEYISYDSKKLNEIAVVNGSEDVLDISLQPSTIKVGNSIN